MSNYSELKKAVTDVIKANGNEEITGQVMQQTLLSLINSIGSHSTFAGLVTPTTPAPPVYDENVFYLAAETGTYANYGGLKVEDGNICAFLWDGTWKKQTIKTALQQVIRIEDIDNIPEEAYYKRATLVVRNNLNLNVGKLLVFSDATKGGYTQFFFTHYELLDGVLRTDRVDWFKPHLYFRRATTLNPIEGIPLNTWGRWHEYSSGGEIFTRCGFTYKSDYNDNIANFCECISGFRFSIYGKTDNAEWVVLQQGWSDDIGHPLFIYSTEYETSKNIQRFDIKEETVRPSGNKRYVLDNGVVNVQFVFDWDTYNKYFPDDLFRGGSNKGNRLYFVPQQISKPVDASTTKPLGSSISLKYGDSVLLAGASFANETNGWFELACARKGLKGYNTSIGGTSILDDMERMYDAGTGKLHGSLFQIGGKDVFNEVNALVLMHVHNQDVYLSDEDFERNTLDWYKTHKPKTYAEGFDYVIKRYQQWCAEAPTKNKPVAGGSVLDSQGTKECQILICSHWNASRELYNSTSRKLAARYGLSYCAFDTNLGFSKENLVTAKTNTDADNTIRLQVVSPTVLMSRFTQMHQGKAIGKTEVIGGVTWGWHPQGREKSYNYGNPVELDGFYYPNVQYTLCGIFMKSVKVINKWQITTY